LFPTSWPKFDIIEDDELEALKEELIRFKGFKVDYYKTNSLEVQEQFQLLSKIDGHAETLPTSSATVEQSFFMH